MGTATESDAAGYDGRVQCLAILKDLVARPKLVRTRAKQIHTLFPESEAVGRWGLEARRYLVACGCKTSAGVALVLAVAGLIYAFLQPTAPWFVAGLRGIVDVTVGFLIGAVIGKAAGLLRARLRFVARTRSLIAYLSAYPAR